MISKVVHIHTGFGNQHLFHQHQPFCEFCLRPQEDCHGEGCPGTMLLAFSTPFRLTVVGMGQWNPQRTSQGLHLVHQCPQLPLPYG